ncbi:MAG: hypothetical protein ACRDUA_04460 [Micromonosporaceae bacterium]
MPVDEATAEKQEFCAECGGKVVSTDVGWTHVDRYGGYQGWLCPEPHVGIADPVPLANRGP